MNHYYDAQARLYEAIRAVRTQLNIPLDWHVLVLHPAKWAAIVTDAPIAGIGGVGGEVTRLFGFDVHLDPTVDEEYIALRHEVRA